MRTLLLTLASLLVLTAVQAQQDERGYFGIKGGVNLANIRSANHFTDGDLLNTKTGLAAGAFYHIGIAKGLSIQPELLYSQMGSEYDDNTSATLNTKGKLNLNYLSLPILIKVNPFKPLGIFVGPQLDYYLSVKLFLKMATGKMSPCLTENQVQARLSSLRLQVLSYASLKTSVSMAAISMAFQISPVVTLVMPLPKEATFIMMLSR
jgi:hypothetical protein